MTRDCQVFISHAGEDRESIAIPLREALAQRSISSFLDVYVIKSGDDIVEEITYHVNKSSVAVFILTPHFLAKKWPMKELLLFLERLDTAEPEGASRPVLIPVFYGITEDQCKTDEIFGATDADGVNIFVKYGFFKRAGDDEITVKQVKDAMTELCKKAYIKNLDGATNDNDDDMFEARSRLVGRIADAVERVVEPPHSSEGNADNFVPSFRIPSLSDDDILNFETQTAEGKLKARLLSIMPQPNNLSATPSDRILPHIPCALGMSGVGKSRAMIGIGWESDMRERFKDGIYFISAGADADVKHMLGEISKTVEDSGGNEIASLIRKASDLERGVKRAKSWFQEKTVLFLLDDLWETSIGIFKELKQLVSAQARLLITTQSETIAQAAGCIQHFNAFEPESDSSRRMFLHYAGIPVDSNILGGDDSNNLLTEILGRCAGLPLALGIAGRSIREIMGRGEVNFEKAMQICCKELQEGRSITVISPSGTAKGLLKTVRIGLMIADQWFEKEAPFSGADSALRPSALYERLAILRKKSRVSLNILSKIWGASNLEQTMMIAEKLRTLSLLFKENESYTIHDLLMEVSITTATTNERLHSHHESFLKAFRCPVVDGTKRAWWEVDVDHDDYLRENLPRHLIGSNRLTELCELLIDARWTLYRVRGCNYLSWQNDFTEFYQGIGQMGRIESEEARRDLRWRKRGIELIQNTVSLAWSKLQANPSELAFQIAGRLGSGFSNFIDVKNFVRSAIESNGKPCLKPKQPCLPDPNSAAVLEMELGENVMGLILDNTARWAYVALRDGIVSVDLISRTFDYIDRYERSDCLSLAISGDNQRVVSNLSGKGVQLWEVDGPSLRRKKKWLLPKAVVESVAISNNGKIIALDSENWPVIVGDAENMIELGNPLAETKVKCVALSEDGEWIVTGCFDKNLRVWNTNSMEQLGPPLRGHDNTVLCVEISKDRNTIFSGSNDCTVRKWDVRQWDIRQLDIESGNGSSETLQTHKRGVKCLAWSSKKGMVVSGSEDYTLRVWDTEEMCEVGKPLEGHEGPVTSVAFSQDGEKIVSGSWDGTVRVWDADRIRQRGTRQGDNGTGEPAWPSSRVVSSDSRTRLMNDYPGALQTSPEIEVPYSNNEWGRVYMSKGGERLIFHFFDGTLRVWDVRNMEDVSGCLQDHSVGVSCVVMTDNGQCVVSGSSDGTLRCWGGEPLCQMGTGSRGHKQSVKHLGLSQNGERVVSIGMDCAVRVWKLQGEELSQIYEPLILERTSIRNMECVTVSNDGRKIVAVSRDGTFAAWDAELGSPLGQRGTKGLLLDVKILENDVPKVLCITEEGNELFHLDCPGLQRISGIEFGDYESSEISNIITRLELHCKWNEIRIVNPKPKRRVIGSLERNICIEAWTFIDASQTLVTFLNNKRVAKFQLIE